MKSGDMMATEIDPRLLAIVKAEEGAVSAKRASTGRRWMSRAGQSEGPVEQVDMHVKVSDLAAFRDRPGVHVLTVVGQDHDGAWLLTASVTTERLADILAAPELLVAEAPRILNLLLNHSMNDLRATSNDMPADALSNRGAV
jgi:hypothetical protein